MEKDKNKTIEFLNYIKNPLSETSIAILYDANSVRFDKCQLYSDFVCSLLMLVFDTYLGDVITTEKQQIEHFNWCWDKVVNNFNEEGIRINSKKLYNYFLEFMLEVFYNYEDKNVYGYIDNGILKIWYEVFIYDKQKTQADIDTMVEIYKIFEKSIIIE